MQNYTYSAASETSIAVGMGVHKKTIILRVYNAFTGEILDERELLHGLPKVTKYFQQIQYRHGRERACYEVSSCGFGLQRAPEAQGVSYEVVASFSIPHRYSRPNTRTPGWLAAKSLLHKSNCILRCKVRKT